MWIDTHCHLADPAFDADRDGVFARARSADVHHVIIIADSVASTGRARALAQSYGVSATAGVHPHEASSWTEETAARLDEALDDPVVVAVGETGLDYHYDHAPRPVQRRVFEAQLAIAAGRAMPVVIHAREADADMAAVVRTWGRQVPALVLHSFSSGPEVFDAGMEVGAYFGWSGMVTFKNWTLMDRVLACPADRLLLETDAPYLAPVPHRGTRNEPAYVRVVAQRLAEARAMPLEAFALLTTANALRCFGARVAQPLMMTS